MRSAAARLLRFGFESRQLRECLSLLCVVYCKVEFSELGCSVVQRSPTKFGVSKCDNEASIKRRSWPTRGFCVMENNVYITVTLGGCFGVKT